MYEVVEKDFDVEFEDDFDSSIVVKQKRFVIVDDYGRLIDDAQGYGYKTERKAYRAGYWKFGPELFRDI